MPALMSAKRVTTAGFGAAVALGAETREEAAGDEEEMFSVAAAKGADTLAEAGGTAGKGAKEEIARGGAAARELAGTAREASAQTFPEEAPAPEGTGASKSTTAGGRAAVEAAPAFPRFFRFPSKLVRGRHHQGREKRR